MKQRRGSKSLGIALLATTILSLFGLPSAWAQHSSNLYAFKFFNNGRSAYGGVILDGAGNIYGTSANGGLKNCYHGRGVVYQVKAKPTGGYSYSGFCRCKGGSDGAKPYAGWVLDSGGNCYGTAAGGGNNS